LAVHRISYVFRLTCDPPVYVWTGFADLRTAPDAVDPSGALWRGLGELVSLPTIRQLINGVADKPTFQVSGVTAAMLALAVEDRESVKGAEARIGKVEFGSNWQPLGPIIWEWRGFAGTIATDSTDAGNGNRDRSVSLPIASADTYRSNPRLSFFTAADQAKASPTDRFCSHVAGISAGTTRRFGPS
jgi:hypothetical protein